MDIECKNHMANVETIFKSIDKSAKVKVPLGNDIVVESKGKGTVMVEKNTSTRLIHNVLLVPNLKENLLSMGQMMERGYTLHFEKGVWKILDNKNKRPR